MKLPCYLYEGKKSGLKNYGCRIFFTNKGTENLCEMIKEFVPPSLQYKLLDEYKGFFNESLWSNSTALPFYDESKVEWAPDNKTTSGGNTVYCLEVESPHSNFAANAVIVHNCEEDIKSVGFKFHMNNINAAIGLANIKHIDSIVGQHKANAKYYDLMLAGMSGVKLLKRDERDDPAFWIYSILVENKPDFMRAMKDRGIMTSQVHERNDKHSCVKEFKTFLPNLDKIIPQLVHIPVGWWLGRKECDQVIDAMAKGW